jgi:HemY protein
MIRLVLFLAVVIAAAWGLSWLADRPGVLVINWQGYEVSTTVFRAIVIGALVIGCVMLLWSLVRHLLSSPFAVSSLMRRRREKKGLEALTSGLIAVGSGDRGQAVKYAQLARKSLPNEPLTQLLRAQTAQLIGDRGTARRIYEAMRNNPETELLGLRGLYLEARRQNAPEAARQFAERAVALSPKLGWSIESLFEMQCREGDWEQALETLALARKNGHIDKAVADRRRAVLLSAQAMTAEDEQSARALALALEAHGLAPDLVPPAAIASRLLASQGATPKAAKIIEKTWRQSPHPDLALVYAYARVGDSPRDRLSRVKDLARLNPRSDEGPIAVATAAIEAQAWDEARRALQHLVDDHPSQRVCTLMARLEGGQTGDAGKVREWLARAVTAPRDPAWIADGHVSARWAPISPVTGELDAYKWQRPTEALQAAPSDLLLEQLMPGTDALVASPPLPPSTTPPMASPESEPEVQPTARPSEKGSASPATIVPEAVAVVPVAASLPKSAAAAPVPVPGVVSVTGNGTAAKPEPIIEVAVTPRAPKLAPQKPATVTPAAPPAAAAEPPTISKAQAEPRIFVPPRAPDDPGLEAADGDEARAPMARVRRPAGKGSS